MVTKIWKHTFDRAAAALESLYTALRDRCSCIFYKKYAGCALKESKGRTLSIRCYTETVQPILSLGVHKYNYCSIYYKAWNVIKNYYKPKTIIK